MVQESPDQIKDIVIRLKSLQQKICPINIGAGATRPYVYIIFDKEAGAQFTPKTVVYLSWRHTEGKKVKGYNVFEQTSEDPNIWRIALPQAMLHEGAVLARIELVDNISIAASRTFEINILHNPNGEESFTDSDDYTLFQDAILALTDRINETAGILEETQTTVKYINDLFEQMKDYYNKMKCEQKKNKKMIHTALDTSYNAMAAAMEALNRLTWGKV